MSVEWRRSLGRRVASQTLCPGRRSPVHVVRIPCKRADDSRLRRSYIGYQRRKATPLVRRRRSVKWRRQFPENFLYSRNRSRTSDGRILHLAVENHP